MHSSTEFDEDSCDYYVVTQRDLTEVLPKTWHAKFVALKVTPPGRFIRITPKPMEYFRDPKFILPSAIATSGDSGSTRRCSSGGSSSSSWASDNGSSNLSGLDNPLSSSIAAVMGVSSEEDNSPTEDESSESNSEPPPFLHPQFKDFVASVTESIKLLGGTVMPKVNWKVPQDARWMAFNKSMKCSMAGDVLLLLKGSSMIDSLIKLNGPDGEVYDLFLSKWCDQIAPDNQFRCFVVDKKLLLICQREVAVGTHDIAEQRDAIIKDVYDFFRKFVCPNFPLDNYVFDVARIRPRVIVLLDFNVFGLVTQTPLTSYRELKCFSNEMRDISAKGTGGGDNVKSRLEETEIYGEPYFRYVTSTGIIAGISWGLVRDPVNLDVITYLTQTMEEGSASSSSQN